MQLTMKKYFTLIFFVLAATIAFSQSFDKYDLNEIIKARSEVVAGNQFDKYDVKEIIRISPSLVTMIATKFDKYDVKEILN
jgi:hypothetical protein